MTKQEQLDEFLYSLNAMCTDGSCIFRPSSMKGMVTNGGCKCCGEYSKKHQLQRLIYFLKRGYLNE